MINEAVQIADHKKLQIMAYGTHSRKRCAIVPFCIFKYFSHHSLQPHIY